MTDQTENNTPAKSTKARNSISSVQIQIKPKSQFEFVPRVPRYLRVSIWWIPGMLHFSWKLSYIVQFAAFFFHIYISSVTHLSHRVVQSHRMPYLYGSFSAKEPYNQWLICGKQSMRSGILWVVATLYLRPTKHETQFCERDLFISKETHSRGTKETYVCEKRSSTRT